MYKGTVAALRTILINSPMWLYCGSSWFIRPFMNRASEMRSCIFVHLQSCASRRSTPQWRSTEQPDVTSLPDKSCQPGDMAWVMSDDSPTPTLVESGVGCFSRWWEVEQQEAAGRKPALTWWLYAADVWKSWLKIYTAHRFRHRAQRRCLPQHRHLGSFRRNYTRHDHQAEQTEICVYVSLCFPTACWVTSVSEHWFRLVLVVVLVPSLANELIPLRRLCELWQPC